ncbi:MAG: acetyl-CoA carboxylase biotin carboxyl carrier protein [Candidatus Dadabacteria bacterium]|nr:MAG: acetyl-CoA carboxylase biotin carboxyl carrier protein [Candidatus Dadabacteria bacterium]
MDIVEKLKAIIGILRESDITEFELIEDGTHIKLSRGALEGAPLPIQPSQAAIPPDGNAKPEGEEDEVSPNWIKVESPIVGTFYRKPSPDAEPFVNEGDIVKKGDTLCIVEAMKLMNEIEAPEGGRIEKILLADGQVVEYGEVLFYINPMA